MKRVRNLFFKSPMLTGFAAFMLVLGFGLYLSWKEYQYKLIEEQKSVLIAANLIEGKIQGVMGVARSTVNILAYLVKTERVGEDFDEVGRSILENSPLIDQIQFLDSGVIVATYPLEGNESVIGYNILTDPKTAEEAKVAIQKRKMFFAGPLNLRQGGKAIIGRLPLYENEEFKGFAAVIINWEKFKELIFTDPEYTSSNFTLKLFKRLPDGTERLEEVQNGDVVSNGSFEEIRVEDGNWTVRVQLINSQAWGAIFPMTILRVIVAFIIWFLIYRFSVQPHVLRKKIAETTRELQQSNQRFKLASQANAEVIWDWDLVTDITVRSENFEKLLGYDSNEETQNDGFWKGIIHPDDMDRVEENLSKTFKSKELRWSQEFRIKHANNHYIDVIDKGIIIRNKAGAPTRMIGSTQDITYRKRTETEIVNQKKRFANVLEGTNAGIWEWNIRTGETVYNETWANIIGYTLDELAPTSFKTWEDYTHPKDFKESNRLLDLHFSGQTATYEVECRMRHKDGHWVWVMDRGKVLAWDSDGAPLMMFGTHVDITEKKQQQEELKISNLKLQSANEELKSFASVASHDMKEPLRMISVFLSLLEKKYQPLLDEKGLQYISFAVDGAKRLSVLIDDLMGYAKIGFDVDLIERVSLNSLIKEVISIKQTIIDEKQATIHLEPIPDVMGIKTPLKSVFLNLVSNALKYHQRDQPLVIKISSKDLGDRVQITVEDNGIGIEPEYSQKIFEVFGRIHHKNEFDGSGLGLAICKKVINQHGGEIWLDSVRNKGSKFHFTLTKYESPTH